MVACLSVNYLVHGSGSGPEWEVRGCLVLAWTLVVRKSGLTLGRPVWIWMFRLMLSDLDLSGQKPSELGCLV